MPVIAIVGVVFSLHLFGLLLTLTEGTRLRNGAVRPNPDLRFVVSPRCISLFRQLYRYSGSVTCFFSCHTCVGTQTFSLTLQQVLQLFRKPLESNLKQAFVCASLRLPGMPLKMHAFCLGQLHGNCFCRLPSGYLCMFALDAVHAVKVHWTLLLSEVETHSGLNSKQ